MPKATPKRDLVIIGTARKPNASDLRNRGLTGLPDPSSDVTRRRAELEAEKAALRAGWDFFGKGEGAFVFADGDEEEEWWRGRD